MLEELAKILFNFNWLQAKTDKALVQELIQDYGEALWALHNEHPMRDALEILQSGIRLSAPVVSKDKNQLASQLVGRMAGLEQTELRQLLSAARKWRSVSWLCPLQRTLSSPGSLCDG